MRIHFGHQILIVFISFGTLMGYLVYRTTQTNFELVAKDYYQQEIAYQEIIDARNNQKTLSAEVKLLRTAAGLQLQFPPEQNAQLDSGMLELYCAADSKRDRKIILHVNNSGQQLIENNSLPGSGNYIAKIRWSAAGIPYYQENKLLIP